MDPLTILGIACNVIQVLSFSHEVLSICKKVYDDESLVPDLEDRAIHLQALANELETALTSSPAAKQNATLTPAAHAPDQTQNTASKARSGLQDVALKLLRTIADLNTIIGKLKVNGPASRHKALLKTAKYIVKYRRRIRDLQSNVENLEKTMNTEILVKLHLTQEAQALLAREDFASLNEDLKKFTERYAEGNTTVSSLISSEAKLIRKLVTDESATTREDLKQTFISTNENIKVASTTIQEHVTRKFQDLDSNTFTKEQHKILLQSLMYPEINDRRSNITEPHEDTFRWVLDHDYEGSWDSFPDWLNSDSQKIYWMSGKAGSGKSSLMKFVAESVETKELLFERNPNTHILSFYFWNSGKKLQRSLVGMLSSLLHQILLENRAQITSLLSENSSLLRKNYISDWSVRELEQAIIKVFVEQLQKYCIFIDGLDEINNEDGQFELLRILEIFRLQPNVKLCVSSRPEPILVKSLNSYPKLRLQDLTKEDIRRYAVDILNPLDIIMGTNEKDDAKKKLINQIAYKSDGVFLWVHLALKSLRTGITNEDNWEMLIKRLDRLPSDMYKLYSHMWSRLNEDQELYRAEAAHYFQLMLLDLPYGFNTLIEIAFASEQVLDDEPLLRDYDSAELIKICKKVEQKIMVRCAGLLEVRQNDLSRLTDEVESFEDPQLSELCRLAYHNVSFIHRSARDFVLDSSSEQIISKQCSKPMEELFFDSIRGCIARTLRKPLFLTTGFVRYGHSWREENEPGYYFTGIALNLHFGRKYLSEDQIFQLLDWYWTVHKQDFQRIETSVTLLCATALFGFYRYVRTHVEIIEARNGRLSEEIKSRLLQAASCWDYLSFPSVGGEELEEKSQLIDWLLDTGADPNLAVSTAVFVEYSTPFATELKDILFLPANPRMLLAEAVHRFNMKNQTSAQRKEPQTISLRTTNIMYLRYMPESPGWKIGVGRDFSKMEVDMWKLHVESVPIWVVVQANSAWLVEAIKAKWRHQRQGQQPQIEIRDITSLISEEEVPVEFSIVEVFLGQERLSKSALDCAPEDIMKALIQALQDCFKRIDRFDPQEERIKILIESLWEATPEKVQEDLQDWYVRTGKMHHRYDDPRYPTYSWNRYPVMI